LSDGAPAIPDNWPAMSIAEAEALLTGPGKRFEIAEAMINGRPTRVWATIAPTLRHIFDNARAFGEREFLVYEDDRASFEAFARAAIRLARRLEDDGVRKGDRVAIVMRNLTEWPVAFYAAVLAGAIATPLNAWWTGDELQFGLADSGAKVAIVDDERLARIQPHLAACPALRRVYVARGAAAFDDPRLAALEGVIGKAESWAALPDEAAPAMDFAPEDNAVILYTSGTTGRPKGALATHRNLVSSIAGGAFPAMRNLLRAGQPLPDADPKSAPQRVNLLAVPLFHGTGLTGQLVIGMNAGMKLVMMRRWDVDQAVALIEREKVTSTGGVPTIAWQLVERAERGDCDLSSLTGVSFGGAPAAPELVRRIKAVFPRSLIATGWGMTETCAAFTGVAGLEYETHPGATGPAVPVSDMQIRDVDDGRTILPTGTVGELWVRGPQVVKGYWNRPEANAETFVDGWMRTGDLGRVDDEGFLTIVDRAKDMLIRGGENIYCLEVENVLYEHPDVMDAALVGLPHRTLGEEPAAVVHLRPGGAASEAELRGLVRMRLAAFKVPVKVMFWPEPLPRNANGKILKGELRKAVLEDKAEG
jgi:long-chain acyl-CoA synthetase